MTRGRSTASRAVIGGSVVLIAVVLAVVLLGGQDDDETLSEDPGSPETFVLDADAGGAVLSRGQRIMGVSASGDVKWRLPIGERDLLSFAVCLRTCPRAEVTFARSGSEVPDLPDGPRLRFSPPSWRPVAVAPRLRVDRPFLPGPVALRVTIARAGSRPSLSVAGGQSVGAQPVPVLAANRRVGLLVGPVASRRQRAVVLRRQSTGWSVASVRRLDPAADSACISPDGSRIGLVGGGPPRVAEVAGGRMGPPRTLAGSHPGEVDAGACALSRDTVATAVLTSGDSASGGVLLRVHAGRRVRTLRPSGRPFYDMWVSPRTGTTAVRIGSKVLLVDAEGDVKTLAAEAAAVSAPGRLRLIPRRGRAYTRPF